MKARKKSTVAKKKKGAEDSTKKTRRSESKKIAQVKSKRESKKITEVKSKQNVENTSFSSEENEQSEIEAELPVEVKSKIFLKDEGVIEIDKKRYTVDRAIKGDYGIVGLMEGGNSKALFALHYEAQNCKIKRLQVEIDLLKSSSKVRKLTHISSLISQGKNSKVNIRYFMTKMFGETINDLRARFGEFSTATSLKLSYLAVECIEEIHKIGFIHRDIKPAIYAVGLESEESQLFILGFGLARRYKAVNRDTSVKKRDKVHRMGNIRYMSRSSHKRLERSRKDDLESWLYMIVEFFLTTSSLPWEDEKNHTTVLKKKEAFMNKDYLKIFKKCTGLPTGINTVLRQIKNFQYDTTPDYHLIKNIFRNAIVSGNYKSEKLDWLKGKEELVRAGACESKIFDAKSERSVRSERSERSERSVRSERSEKSEISEREKEQSQRPVKQETIEYDLGAQVAEDQRSVQMMPAVNRTELLNSLSTKSHYCTPKINDSEISFLQSKTKSRKNSPK